jgi:hypothetical protein
VVHGKRPLVIFGKTLFFQNKSPKTYGRKQEATGWPVETIARGLWKLAHIIRLLSTGHPFHPAGGAAVHEMAKHK